MHEETRDTNTTGLLILCLPTTGTSEIKTLPLACMQGPFNYSWKVHSICRIVLLLACSARSVLFQAQDEWHYLLYSYYRLLPLLAAGVRRDAIYHARRVAGFLSNTFSLQGVHSAHLWCIFKFTGHLLLIYFAFGEQAIPENFPHRSHCPRHCGVKKYWVAGITEHPVGINLNFFKGTCWKSINKPAARVFDSWTAWRLCLWEDYCR